MKKNSLSLHLVIAFCMIVCSHVAQPQSKEAPSARTTCLCSPNGVTVAGGNGRGGDNNQLAQPNGLFRDNHNNIWIADPHNGRISKWAQGSTVGIPFQASAPNAPWFATQVFVDKKGKVYAADYFASNVVMFDNNTGTWVVVAETPAMDLTRGVWVDKRGNVFATDYGNNRVLKFTPGNSTGVVVAGGNGYGSALNQLARPVSVFVDEKGAVYVTDHDNSRVVKWKQGATQGIVVAGGHGSGDAADQLNGPVYAHVDNKGNVYVADRNNDRIQKWTPGSAYGVTVAGGNGSGNTATQLYQPYSSFVDGHYLYVVDSENDRVQRFNTKEKCNTDNNDNYQVQPVVVSSSQQQESRVAIPIEVFPNPSSYNFTLAESQEYVSSVVVKDLKGRVVYSCQSGMTLTSSFGETLQPGIYIIKIKTARSEWVYRLVKN